MKYKYEDLNVYVLYLGNSESLDMTLIKCLILNNDVTTFKKFEIKNLPKIYFLKLT